MATGADIQVGDIISMTPGRITPIFVQAVGDRYEHKGVHLACRVITDARSGYDYLLFDVEPVTIVERAQAAA